jgi:micrococcal nuclease|tara:strand:- start:163 stop:594 length:432 start_codon:yes stop_codon:yes gene_type:complete
MFEYNFKLRKIVDGDTIDVDIDLGFGVWLKKQRIRMMGIDTPESRTSDDEEKVYGLLAKQRLTTLLADAKVLKTYNDERGKYGRILGEVICYFAAEDRWAGSSEIMISEGHGVAYHGQSKDDIAEEHLANRLKLKASGLVNKE